MTAIAYRNGVMAGDTQAGFGHVVASDQKVFKHDGYLVGVSGARCPSNDDISRWLFLDINARRRPEFKGGDFEILVVSPKGKMLLWYSSGLLYPVPASAKFWAIGAGAEVCMGAMEAGASAERAVAAAIKWQRDCGGHVTAKRLRGK